MTAHTTARPTALVARDLVRTFGDKLVLDGVDLVANPGEPVGVVGENGVGKSTLLGLLAGVDTPDSGSVTRPVDTAYLGQEVDLPPRATVDDVLGRVLAPLHDAVRRLERLGDALAAAPQDEALAAEFARVLAWAEHHDAWDAERRAEVTAERLGVGRLPRDRPVARLSGGERTRLALAAVIVRRPDCVVLDEPMNHLDDAAMAHVEEFLVSTPGVVVVASHDRVLLDRVARVVVDLDPSYLGVDGRGGTRYTGGFSDYLTERKASRRRWEEVFVAQRDELAGLRLAERTTARTVAHDRGPRDNDKFIHAFKGANVARTIARRVHDVERRIEVIERDPVPKPPRPLRLGTELTDVGRGDGGSVGVRDLLVAGRVRVDRLDVGPGDRLLVTGPNGSGKSTLLGVLAGEVVPTRGEVDVAARRLGLLPQDVVVLDPERSAVDAYRSAAGPDAPPLGELGLLHPREQGTAVGALSVGQRRRLALATIVATGPDLLLLDEPTNHISLALASELEEALGTSVGTVVVTSHDRWLRERWDGPVLGL